MVVLDWVSDSDDSDKFEWESDGGAEPSWAPALRNLDAPGPSTQDSNGWANGEAKSTSLLEVYVGMGFPKEMVVKAIMQIGHSDENALLELLLTYQVLGDNAAVGNCSASSCPPPSVEDDYGAREPNSDSSGDEVDDTLS